VYLGYGLRGDRRAGLKRERGGGGKSGISFDAPVREEEGEKGSSEEEKGTASLKNMRLPGCEGLKEVKKEPLCWPALKRGETSSSPQNDLQKNDPSLAAEQVQTMY